MKLKAKGFYGLLIIGVLYLAILAGCGGTTTTGTTTATDTTTPSSPSVSINTGASSTSSTTVTLAISATDGVGVTGYYASETSTVPSASATGWTSVTSTTSYSASVSFTLSSGDATKTVYVWFKDAAGNVSAAASDTITLSTKFAIATTTEVATTQDSKAGREMSVSAAFDGTNYLVGIQGDATSHADVTAQLISSTGSLVGSRISTGRTGSVPHIAFNGTNYLMVWEDEASSNAIYGQIINTSGTAVTSPFAISTTTGTMRLGWQPIVCNSTACTVVWNNQTTGKIYTRHISSDGTFLTDEILSYTDNTFTTPVTSAKSVSVALGASTNFVVWDTGTEIRGSMGTPSGTNVKLNFVIATKAPTVAGCTDHNPVGIAFDSTNYLVVWNDHSDCAAVPPWDLLAQRVDESGNLAGASFKVNSANSNRAVLPTIAFDGTNLLVVWTDGRNDANRDVVCNAGEGTCYDVYGQYVSKAGTLVGSEFVINNDAGNQWGFVTGFNNGKYLVLENHMDTFDGTKGDVYGVFITP